MTKRKIFKVHCEYYIKAKDLEEVINYVTGEIADGFDFYNRHLIIEQSEIKVPKSEIFTDLTK